MRTAGSSDTLGDSVVYRHIYDDFRRLTAVSIESAGVDLASFSYDGDGKRIRKTSATGDTIYHYDAKGRLLSESMIDGTPICDYVYLNDMLVAKIVPGQPDQVYAYHTDPLGSPLAMTQAGEAVWQADYEPFGCERSVAGTASNDERFAGSKKDDETGLNYFIHRYMDPTLGRFTSPDPIGAVDPKTGKINQVVISEPQRLSPYTYVSNNPLNFVDPSGLLKLHIDQLEKGRKDLVENAALGLQSFINDNHRIISYFDRFGYDIRTAITPGEMPDLFIDLKLQNHGYSTSYESITLGHSCFDTKDMSQAVKSTITHELGHIAESWSDKNSGYKPDISDIFSRPYYNRDREDGIYGYTTEWLITCGI